MPTITLSRSDLFRASKAVTAVAATDVFTSANHGYVVGDVIQFSALTGGAGISTTTPYYVIAPLDANTFKVSTTPGGAALDVTTDLTAGTVGTNVGIYPAGARNPGSTPTAAVIAFAAVDAAGLLTVTDAGILQGVRYVAYSSVGGVPTYCACRSTLDKSDTGVGSGTGTTTSGSPIVTALTATSGAFAVGQRMNLPTPGVIPPGTHIKALTASGNKSATGDTAGLITSAAHGFIVGDVITFSALTGGTGLTTGTLYYVRDVTTNTFKLSTTPGGTPVTPSTTLTASTLSGVALLTDNALASGAQNFVAEGASPAVVPPDKGVGAMAAPVAVSKWRAKVRQRRVLAGTE
jgi:tetrahydromethanopterin S-methyltransferase subunit B